MNRIIGAQMFTIRDHLKNEAEIEASIQTLKEIGYTHGQKSGFTASAEFMKQMIDKYDFPITATHSGFDYMCENTDEVISDHKTMGCAIAGTGSMPDAYRNSKEAVYAFIEKANILANKLAEAGLTFTYHNHAFEFVKFDGKYLMDYLLEGCNENVKLMVDVYWLAVAGIQPVEFMEKNKSRIAAVHYKDLKVVDNAPTMCEVGCGNLDWDKIIAFCDTLGVPIYVEQDTNFEDSLESIRISYNYLKEKGYK